MSIIRITFIQCISSIEYVSYMLWGFIAKKLDNKIVKQMDLDSPLIDTSETIDKLNKVLREEKIVFLCSFCEVKVFTRKYLKPEDIQVYRKCD